MNLPFNDRSRGRLEGVNPVLVQILSEARRRSGIPVEISEGMRSREDQARYVKEGKSQTMNSYHLHGGATDVHILNPDGSVNWDFEAYRPFAEAAKEVAAEMGIGDFVWGGDWETLKDGVHFQLGGPRSTTPAPQGNNAFDAFASYEPVNAFAQYREQEQEQQQPQRPQIGRYLDPRAFMQQPQQNALAAFDTRNPYTGV